MFPSQRKPAPCLTDRLSLNCHVGMLGCGPSSAVNDMNPRDPHHVELTSIAHISSPSSSASAASTSSSSRPSFSDSPKISSPDSCFSQLTITTKEESNGPVHSWFIQRRTSVTPKLDLDSHTHQRQDILRRQSTGSLFERTYPPLRPAPTFGFTFVSSPDADITGGDVIPKVEEIDDNVPLSTPDEHAERDIMGVAGDRQDTGSAAPDPLLPPKRKRGRPRKHPLPVPGQAKATKGRSKTGCITCRRRKKKCDETKPACLNCEKNAVVCEGYPVKEVWKSGKQKLEEAARRNSFAAVPRGLPLLIDGIETDIDRRFLDHFVYDFSRVLTLINDDSNPFKEILLPMAAQNRGLMHALMCLSGSHLSSRYSEPFLRERKNYHFSQAIAELRLTVAARSESNEPESPVDDPMIASTIALCLNTICEGETQGEYRSHMDAARYLLATQRPRNEKFRQFIVEFFQYHDVSNSLTTLDRRPICLTGDLRLPDFVPHAQAGALLGIFDGLFQYISEITVIRDKIRQRLNHGADIGVDYEILSDAVAIDSSIRSWEPTYPPGNPNWFAAQLYRQSTWVYLYRTIRPSRPCEKISQVVDDGLLYFEQLPKNTGAYSIMLMPLFLLGCSAFEKRQRERIREGFDDLKAYSNLRNIQPALKIVERVWEVMDTDTDQSWDWEKIIDEMGMDFLIT